MIEVLFRARCRCMAATTLLAMASTMAVAGEPSWRDFPGVSNSSFVEPGGDRALQLSIEIAAAAHEVWTQFATSDGFASWAAPVAHVDLRVGGSIEASYDPHAKLGDAGNIRNEILAYIPDRLLVIRNSHTPPGFVDAELFQRTVTVIELAPLTASRTRVTVTNLGYGTGERYDAVYRHFEWGNAYTLAGLRARFERGPVDWAAQQQERREHDAGHEGVAAH